VNGFMLSFYGDQRAAGEREKPRSSLGEPAGLTRRDKPGGSPHTVFRNQF
jgi:hypothetical protein